MTPEDIVDETNKKNTQENTQLQTNQKHIVPFLYFVSSNEILSILILQ